MKAAAKLPYISIAGHYDEMTGPSGALRPGWTELMGSLDALGEAEFLERWQEAQRLIQENGVTYNVYGDPRGIDRPWQLDPIPLLISRDEWQQIEAAVEQRATLLNRILADLYGPRRLLQEGRLPAELVLGHPGYWRPCHGVKLPGDVHLHLYAVDLARSPDGQWWAINDRSQAPSGAGYALENRVVMSRVLPELFRTFYVERLAGSFQAYRETLMKLAPTSDGEPRMVLLTPGPYNETYFEHAYLARYLGITLVEGSDLTVRGDRVFLKTLSGLLPVHAILRRQDDRFCDPLELWGGSALGTPGLVRAVRAGNVLVANALGSGVVENAALMAFLPGLCRHLLGEELRMPSAATWWCGQSREREEVLAHLDQLVVKPTFPRGQREVVFGADLSAADRKAFAEQIRRAPHEYVAQEQVALSTVPCSAERRPSPRHLLLRVYAMRSGDGYQVMPGGLTRVSAASDSLVVSGQQGGGSKDTWVLSDAPVAYTSLMDSARRAAGVSRGTFALTSRAADDLLWLGRNSERLDAGLRLFRIALRRLLEEPLRASNAPAPDSMELLDRLGLLPKAKPKTSLADRLLHGLFERDWLDGPGGVVRLLHRQAWQVRDRISEDAWRILSQIEQEFLAPRTHAALRTSAALQRVDRALLGLAAFTGLVVESMTRGLGWQFLEIGRRLERGLWVATLLRRGLVETGPRVRRRLANVLEAADSTMTYRSRYLTSVELPLVLDLLLLDEANPRSVAFQLVRLDTALAALPKAPREEIQRLLDRVRSASVQTLAGTEEAEAQAGDGGASRADLDELLAHVEESLPRVADALNHAYLAHAIPRRRPPALGSGPS